MSALEIARPGSRWTAYEEQKLARAIKECYPNGLAGILDRNRDERLANMVSTRTSKSVAAKITQWKKENHPYYHATDVATPGSQIPAARTALKPKMSSSMDALLARSGVLPRQDYDTTDAFIDDSEVGDDQLDDDEASLQRTLPCPPTLIFSGESEGEAYLMIKQIPGYSFTVYTNGGFWTIDWNFKGVPDEVYFKLPRGGQRAIVHCRNPVTGQMILRTPTQIDGKVVPTATRIGDYHYLVAPLARLDTLRGVTLSEVEEPSAKRRRLYPQREDFDSSEEEVVVEDDSTSEEE